MHLTRCTAIAGLWVTLNVSVIWAQSQQNFIPVTPCRVADTRLATGTFGGPTMAAGSTRNFPIPSSSCGIPSTATAYSLNVTVVPAGGPLFYLTIWPTGQAQPVVSTLNSDSGLVVANAAIVPAGTSATGGAVSVYVTNATDVILDIDGYFVAQTFLSSNATSLALGAGSSALGQYNTAIGYAVLANNNPNGTGDGDANGEYNTGVGSNALLSNTLGQGNTAIGADSLIYNTTGSANVAVGLAALQANTTGGSNTAVGSTALGHNTVGQENTASGIAALQYATGDYNSALGGFSLGSLAGGNNNIGIGYESGFSVTNGSYNIEIANSGGTTDSGVIRIGDSNQTSAYISGIFGVNPGSGGAVFITSSGQLYSPSSSQRYKDDIRDMGDASNSVMQLRPVTFRYKQPTADGSKPLEYGLIAEEVAKIYPELVVYGKDGEVESVQYHQLPALLLNELQKQQKKIDQQESTIRQLESRLAALEGSSRE
jgi:hypothetical protein